MKYIYGCLTGAVVAILIFHLAVLPTYNDYCDTRDKEIKEWRNLGSECAVKLSETRELLTTSQGQTKQALEAGEKCIMLLYTAPLEAIQGVREALPITSGTFDTGTAPIGPQGLHELPH